MCTSLAHPALLSPKGARLIDPFLLPLPGWRDVVATRECDLQGEGHLNSFPLSVPV